jgi:hypothetical protein
MPSGHWQPRARCLVRLDVLARLRRRLSRIARPQSSSSCRFAPETHVIERLSCASAIGSMARSSGWRNSAVCPTPRAWKRLEHFLIANVLRLTPTTAHACAATWRALSAAYDSSGWRGFIAPVRPAGIRATHARRRRVASPHAFALRRREASSDQFRDDRGGETVCSWHTKRSALSAEFDEGTSYASCQDPTATRRSRGLNSHRGLPACRPQWPRPGGPS